MVHNKAKSPCSPKGQIHKPHGPHNFALRTLSATSSREMYRMSRTQTACLSLLNLKRCTTKPKAQAVQRAWLQRRAAGHARIRNSTVKDDTQAFRMAGLQQWLQRRAAVQARNRQSAVKHVDRNEHRMWEGGQRQRQWLQGGTIGNAVQVSKVLLEVPHISKVLLEYYKPDPASSSRCCRLFSPREPVPETQSINASVTGTAVQLGKRWKMQMPQAFRYKVCSTRGARVGGCKSVVGTAAQLGKRCRAESSRHQGHGLLEQVGGTKASIMAKQMMQKFDLAKQGGMWTL
eukprot:1158580-Pelagomonas_calceolata.AAC.10